MRVGSTWIKLVDHIANLKHREEVSVKAELETAENPTAGIGAGKKKKKKKKAKKTAMDLDLDMDADDPTQQTRFAAHMSGDINENSLSLEETKRVSEAKISK